MPTRVLFIIEALTVEFKPVYPFNVDLDRFVVFNGSYPPNLFTTTEIVFGKES